MSWAAVRDAARPRTGPLILTIFGDAILPRGGEVATSALLAILDRLGIPEGVVRTALSRLQQDGWLHRERVGRHSFYQLAEPHRAAFLAAVPRIYAPPSQSTDRSLRLAWPEAGAERTGLEAYVTLAPGVLVAPGSTPAPTGVPSVLATEGDLAALANRAWRLQETDRLYQAFIKRFRSPPRLIDPADALAARVLTIHEFRRARLRDPALSPALLPSDWHGAAAWELCRAVHRAMSPASETWLDCAENRSGPLARGPDPMVRFSGGDRPVPASTPVQSGSPTQPPPAAR